jgi:hypothetical protein
MRAGTRGTAGLTKGADSLLGLERHERHDQRRPLTIGWWIPGT